MELKKIQCELCGSIDIVKTGDDLYVCQHCGCKYTKEEARKLIFPDTVVTKAADFDIAGGVLRKYNGEDLDVVIPDGVIAIGEKAFEGLLIRSVTMPESLVEIRKEAFQDCKYLERVMFGASLKTIGGGAFQGCTALRELAFPLTLEKIDRTNYGCKGAFDGCTALTTINFPEGTRVEIQSNTFFGCPLRDLYVPDGVRCGGHSYTDKEDHYDGDAYEVADHPDYLKEWKGKGWVAHFHEWEFGGAVLLGKYSTPGSRKYERLIQAGKCGYCGGELKTVF